MKIIKTTVFDICKKYGYDWRKIDNLDKFCFSLNFTDIDHNSDYSKNISDDNTIDVDLSNIILPEGKCILDYNISSSSIRNVILPKGDYTNIELNKFYFKHVEFIDGSILPKNFFRQIASKKTNIITPVLDLNDFDFNEFTDISNIIFNNNTILPKDSNFFSNLIPSNSEFMLRGYQSDYNKIKDVRFPKGDYSNYKFNNIRFDNVEFTSDSKLPKDFFY